MTSASTADNEHVMTWIPVTLMG